MSLLKPPRLRQCTLVCRQVMPVSTSSLALGQERSSQPAQPSNPPKPQPQPQLHWLDRSFPGARGWLQRQSLRWWLSSFEAHCRQYAALHGKEAFVRRNILETYEQLAEKYAHLATDGRSQTHIEMAALALATHKTLLPFLHSEQEVLDLLRRHGGAQTSAALRAVLRFSLWLARDPYGATLRRLGAWRRDLGPRFACELAEGGGQASLKVTQCLYHGLYTAEGAPQLVACSCCSQDAVWFEGLERHGVHFSRSKWLGRSDECCQLDIARVQRGS